MKQRRSGTAWGAAGVAAAALGGALGVALAGASLAGAGCNRPASGTTVIKDTGPARLAEAQRLAAAAQAEHRAGNTERAIDLYRRAVANSPELAPAWNGLGLLLMGKDQYLEAHEAFQEAADQMPGAAGAAPLYNIGLLYYRRGWHERAAEHFDRALERDPRHRDALRGSVLVSRGMESPDERALERVRRLLMMETDPRWKRLASSEQFRIELALNKAKERLEMEVRDGVRPGEAVPAEPVEPAPGEMPPR